MSNRRQWIGRVFGCWTIIGIAENSSKSPRYKVLCRCGNQSIRAYHGIKSARVRYCDLCSPAPHNCTGAAHKAMRRQANGYHDKRWERYECFVNDMGECPVGHTIDRVHASRPWNKDNCTWVKRKAHNANLIELWGIAMSMHDWANLAGKKWSTIAAIIRGGNVNSLIRYPKIEQLLKMCGKIPNTQEIYRDKSFERER